MTLVAGITVIIILSHVPVTATMAETFSMLLLKKN